MDEKLNSGNADADGRKKLDAGTISKRSMKRVVQNKTLQSLIDKISEAIILTDTQGHIQYLNKDAISLFGEDAVSLKYKEWPQNFGLYLDDGVTHYPSDKLPLSLSLLGEQTQGEEMILKKSNEEDAIWISMSSQPLNRENDGVDGAIVIIQDITFRKQIELSREKHIRRTQSLYKFSHDIAEAGNNLKNTLETIAKFTSEVIGELSIIILKDDGASELKMVSFFDTEPAAYALMRKFWINGKALEMKSGMVTGVIKSMEPLLIPSMEFEQGEAFTIPVMREFVEQIGLESLLIAPLIGRKGSMGAICVSRHRGSQPLTKEDQSFLLDIAYRSALAIDNCRLFESLRNQISERLAAKDELDASEERFRALFEATSLGIKVLDKDGNIQEVNRAFQQMLGYPQDDIVGEHFTKFLVKTEIPRALKLINELKSSFLPQYLFEHRTVRKDGSLIWIKTTFSPVMKGNGREELSYIVGIVEDISGQKRTEMEMKELSDSLQNNIEMERLKLAQELHDNPMQSLYAVIFQLEELRSHADQPLKDALKKATNELKAVIDGLRATAKELRPPTIFDFGLENAIRSHINDHVEKYPNLNFSLSLAQDRQLLPEGTRLALFRVFQNALTNVLRHSEATEIKVRFSFDAAEIHLEVFDNGKGFDVPRTWVEFVRNGHYGLAGIAERISMLGGELVVKSNPGNGTTILARIPWKDSD